MKRSFQLSYHLLLLLSFCKAFCLISTKEHSYLTLREQQRDSSREEADHNDDDDDDDEFPHVDTSNFKTPNLLAFSLNGRSSPSQRKAIGLSRSSNATIHFCENCGTEYVQWVGQCTTCRQWNTLRSRSVPRRSIDEISREFEKWSLHEEESFPVDQFMDDWLEVMPTHDVKNRKERGNETLLEYPEIEKTRSHDVEGCARTIWRMKPVTVKALVVTGSGLRSAEGISKKRLCRTLAILQKQFGVDFRQYDVYVECTAQVERSADLAVVAAVMSSLFSIPVRSDSFLVGEIDLLGNIQPMNEDADLPCVSRIVYRGANSEKGFGWVSCQTISQALDQVLVRNLPSLNSG